MGSGKVVKGNYKIRFCTCSNITSRLIYDLLNFLLRLWNILIKELDLSLKYRIELNLSLNWILDTRKISASDLFFQRK